MNVALYGRPGGWAMTERGRHDLRRDATTLAIGRSSMRWDGDSLVVAIDEPTIPLPGRLRGRVVVRPRALTQAAFQLDAAGRHRWRPLAPLSDVEVHFDTPSLAWRGTGYLDTNDGDEPLEAAFRSWTWSRFDLGTRARIFYDVVRKDGSPHGLSLSIADGIVTPAPTVPPQHLPRTAWGIARPVPCDPSHRPRLTKTLESAPFYARSAIVSQIDGVEAPGVHETLSLGRLVSPEVRFMVPFRMFRRPLAKRAAEGVATRGDLG